MAYATTRKDEMILSALLSTPTVRAAACACKIGETQIYKRLRDEDFKARYNAARLELLDQNAAALQQHITAAIEEMATIALDKAGAAQVRLNACEAIIRTSLKLTEQVDILRRIDKLEQDLRNNDK